MQKPDKTQEIVQILELAKVIFLTKVELNEEKQYEDLVKKSIKAAATFNDVANRFLAIAQNTDLK